MSKVVKAEAENELRIVWSEVYAPMRPDSDGEFMTAETIRKMAHEFSMSLDQVDVRHDNKTVDGVRIVETFIARKGDPDFLEGAWVIGCHVPDDSLWDQIKKGDINGFSVEALVEKVERDMEIEMPAVVTGMTSKSEDHEHKFYVSYDDDLKFMGGTTDEVNGHKHVIVAGTVTQKAEGHSHTFSSVDCLSLHELGD